MKSNKKIWTIVLITSSLSFIILFAPCLEIYFHVNVPFVAADDRQFTIYGIHFVGEQQEFGAMFFLPVLMMVPARFITLAIIKLSRRKSGVVPG